MAWVCHLRSCNRARCFQCYKGIGLGRMKASKIDLFTLGATNHSALQKRGCASKDIQKALPGSITGRQALPCIKSTRSARNTRERHADTSSDRLECTLMNFPEHQACSERLRAVRGRSSNCVVMRQLLMAIVPCCRIILSAIAVDTSAAFFW